MKFVIRHGYKDQGDNIIDVINPLWNDIENKLGFNPKLHCEGDTILLGFYNDGEQEYMDKNHYSLMVSNPYNTKTKYFAPCLDINVDKCRDEHITSLKHELIHIWQFFHKNIQTLEDNQKDIDNIIAEGKKAQENATIIRKEADKKQREYFASVNNQLDEHRLRENIPLLIHFVEKDKKQYCIDVPDEREMYQLAGQVWTPHLSDHSNMLLYHNVFGDVYRNYKMLFRDCLGQTMTRQKTEKFLIPAFNNYFPIETRKYYKEILHDIHNEGSVDYNWTRQLRKAA